MGTIKNFWSTLFKPKQHNKANQLEERTIEELFDDLFDIRTKLNRINHYLEEIADKQHLFSQYDLLDREDIHELNVLAQRAKAIEEKKEHLKGRLISNNAALARLNQYEEEIPEMIKEMQLAEKRRRETESHIFYLQEEKEELVEERESLLLGYSFLKGFSFCLMVGIVICLFVSFALLQILREQIWMIISLIGCITVLFFVGIVYFKDRIDKELSRNVILQQKAAKYLNKTKIRLFNQAQYLEFQYRKLGVDSVAKLELYYNRYLKNKNNERIYLQMNESLNEIEADMLDVLHKKDIKVNYINQLSDWILTPQKLNEMKMMKEDQVKTQEQIDGLKAYEEEIMKELALLAQDEQLKQQIDQRMLSYNQGIQLDKNVKGA